MATSQFGSDTPWAKAAASSTKKTAAKKAVAAKTAAKKVTGKSAKALKDYIANPKTGYSENLNKKALDSFVAKNKIAAGSEMYRTLTPGELGRIKAATDAGLDYKPGQVRSVGGASDLQKLGQSMSRTGGVQFGGANDVANTIAKITAMEDLQGIKNVNRFGQLSELNEEGLLGPKTRYKVLNSTPATKTSPGIMNLGAYANSMAGILGLIPTLLEGGKAFTAKKPTPQEY